MRLNMIARFLPLSAVLVCLAAAAAGRAQTIQITISPGAVTLTNGQQQRFTATVVGAPGDSQEVVWALPPEDEGVGSLNQSGVYVAPAQITAPRTVTITVTSVYDPQFRFPASATVTLMPSGISISPPAVTLTAGQSQVFTATLSGAAAGTGVTWMLQPFNVGTLEVSGMTATYTAPATITQNRTVTIQAFSQADSSKSATATVTLSRPTVELDVGSGAPNESIRNQFVNGYYRNGFHTKVSLPPVANVRRLSGPQGAVGYVQEFQDVYRTSGVRLALVKPNDSTAFPDVETGEYAVYQLTAGVWSAYSSIGASAAGFPTMDAAPCPHFDERNSCEYALFTNNYAIFAYSLSLPGGQNFSIRNQFFTRWMAMGGMGGPGRPVEAEASATSSTAAQGTMQLFASGVIYNFTAGALSGQTHGVSGPIFNLYEVNGMHAGVLGFPTSDEMIMANGLRRQTFEGGAIEWNPGADPTLRFPVAGVTLGAIASRPGGVTLNVGETLEVTARVVGTNGAVLTDRPVSWTTTNGRVVRVQPNGLSAILTAVGGGTAQVIASSEGKTTAPLTIQVFARCCEVGEGATPAVQQAFQDAVQRNRLAVATPVAGPVERRGAGYVQQLQPADPGAGSVYLLAMPDRHAAAYLVTGPILARYLELGGPAGPVGYPIGDASASGRQMFENGALAGAPVRLVAGAVLKKWAALGYETGPAGPPVGTASVFSTFGANSGEQQPFANGLLLAAGAGPRAGQGHLVSGPILERYLELGGPGGAYGMPVSDEFASGAARRQNFEGGYIEYAAGQNSAQEYPAPRRPAVVAAPESVVAGSRVRLAVLGFEDGARVRVSVEGQPDFTATLANGGYAWDMVIPLSARGAAIAVRAVDERTGSAAESSFTVRSFREGQVRLERVLGDGQTGMAGARLPQPLRVALRDETGNPVSGVPVIFEASPGALATPASAVTDAAGQAETVLRLPLAAGIALVTARAAAEVEPVTFTARAAAHGLTNFPKLSQAVEDLLGSGPATVAEKGALLTAAAAILRYHQERGELPAPYGLAEPAALNRFLKDFCVFDSQGGRVCDGFLSNPASGEQVVNLWRVGAFVGGGVDTVVEPPSLDAVRDALAQGSPVLLALALAADGAPVGGHYVVATGVAENGGIAVHDPNPELARPSLGDYLQGFTAGGRPLKATLAGVVRLVPGTPPATRFLLAAVSQPVEAARELALAAASAAGACGVPLELPDAAPSARGSRFVSCDGRETVYQLAVGAGRPWRVLLVDLANGGGAFDLSGTAPRSYRASRSQSILTLGPAEPAITAGGIVNAATYTDRIAPGGLISIFGSGLAAPGGPTVVEIGGQEARVLLATPFQVNAEAPAGLAPGRHVLRLRCPAGQIEQPVEIVGVAPAIFTVGPGRGAIVNQDGTVNGPASPIRRGQVLLIYATGLGTVTQKGDFSEAVEPISVVLAGQEFRPSYAGLAPGFIGLYQIDLPVAVGTAPGIDLPLKLRQGAVQSNTVAVSIQ